MNTLIFFVSTIVLISALSKSWEEVWNKGQQNLEANFRVVLTSGSCCLPKPNFLLETSV